MQQSRRRALIAANALGGAVSWNLANVGGAPDVVAAHYGIGAAALGVMTTVLFVGKLICLIPGGRAADQFGARRAGGVCLGLVMVGNLGVLLLPTYGPALAFRFVIGAAVGMAFVAGAAYIRGAGGTALAQGVYGGTCVGTGGLAIAAVALLEPALGWKAPFASAAVVAGCGLLAVLLGGSTAAPVGARTPPRLTHLMTDGRVWRLSAAQAASFGLSVVLGNWATALLVAHGDYSRELAGLVGSLVLVGGFIGRPLGGVLSVSRPAWTRDLIRASLIVGALSALLLGRPQPVTVAIGAALGVGISAGIPFGPLFAGVARIRDDAPGAAIAFMNSPAIATIAILTPLFGVTFSVPGRGRVGLVVVSALWASAALVLPSRETFEAATDAIEPRRVP